MKLNYHKFDFRSFTHTTGISIGISMSKLPIVFVAALVWVVMLSCKEGQDEVVIGQETSSYERLEDGQEFAIPLKELLKRGKNLIQAQFTPIEGAGRPLSTGGGKPIADPTPPLVFPRQFNRVSARDANTCVGCDIGHKTNNEICLSDQPIKFSGIGFDRCTGKFTINAIMQSFQWVGVL